MMTTDTKLLAIHAHYQTIAKWLKKEKIFADYKRKLIAKLILKTVFMSGLVIPEHRQAIFEALQAALEPYDLKTIKHSLATENIGARGWSVGLAAITSDMKRFEQFCEGEINFSRLSHDINEIQDELASQQKELSQQEDKQPS